MLPAPSPSSRPVASLQTYSEDVRGIWQGEPHTTDDEGQGGQALDIVTVHHKLQRGTGPRGLIAHLRGPVSPSSEPPCSYPPARRPLPPPTPFQLFCSYSQAWQVFNQVPWRG